MSDDLPGSRVPDEAAMTAARSEFQATLTAARAMLDRRRATPVHTPDERAELQRDALSGALGREMRELARHIEAGRDSWPEVFEGTSPHLDLFHDHLDRMAEEHAEEIRESIEDDPDFDPEEPDPELR